MRTLADQQFADQTVELDGTTYERCRFERCLLVYRGGDVPGLIHCEFHDCEWRFDAAAARTLAFLAGLAEGGLGELVDATLESIRNGTVAPGDPMRLN